VHLEDVLLDDVVVLEQPRPRRTDVNAGDRPCAEPDVGVLEDAPRGLQTREESRTTKRSVRIRERLRAGEVAGALAESIGPQQLAPERACGKLVGLGGGREKESREKASSDEPPPWLGSAHARESRWRKRRAYPAVEESFVFGSMQSSGRITPRLRIVTVS
jgi:hypothetical protein